MAKQDSKSKDKFALPSSSYDELKRIIQAYARRNEGVSLDAIAKLAGINATTVSRNNGFLVDTGIITGGNAKGSTELGKRLGRAFEHDRREEIVGGLRELVQLTPFLSDLPTTVRIKGGMNEADFVAHILYASDSSKDGRKTTGANAIAELLVEADLLVNDNGTLRVQTGGTEPQPISTLVPEESPAATTPTPITAQQEAPVTPSAFQATSAALSAASTAPLSIAINIQLQLPETENPAVYDNLFRSLKKHLLSNDEQNAK